MAREEDLVDAKRQEMTAYEYLCHLEEARTWISNCIGEELPSASHLEENLRNGVYLAKIGHYCAPDIVSRNKIFDSDQDRYKRSGLHFKHTENINYFFQAISHIGLPKIFLPETTDVYDRKNMPRAIFCIHALSLILFEQGSAPKIQDLYGRVTFSEDEITRVEAELSRVGVDLPKFSNLGGMLYDGGGNDRKGVEALYGDLSDALESRDIARMMDLLTDPTARLRDVDGKNSRQYMLVLHSEIKDLSRDFTQAEVQGFISRTNLLVVLELVKAEVLAEDNAALLIALRREPLGLGDMIRGENIDLYLTDLLDIVEGLSENEVLKKIAIEDAIKAANQLGGEKNSLEHAIASVNKALKNRDSSKIIGALEHQALRLEPIFPQAADLYFTELGVIQRDSELDLNYDAISKLVAFLGLVAQVSIQAKSFNKGGVKEALTRSDLYLQDIETEALETYAQEAIRQVKIQSSLLTHAELQEIVDNTNEQRQSRNVHRISGIELVNECVRGGGTGLMDALQAIGLTITRREEVRCMLEMEHIKANKSQVEGRQMELWMEDIEDAVSVVNHLTAEAVSVSGALKGLNSAVEYGDVNGVLSYLYNNWELFGLAGRPERRYGGDILSGLRRKLLGRGQHYSQPKHSWVIHYFQDGSKVYLEVESDKISWTKPRVVGECCVLSASEILEAVEEAEGGYSRQLDNLILKLQARIRGYLVRQGFFAMLDWYDRHTADIVKIQALWRGRTARKRVMQELGERIRRRRSALNYINGLGDIRQFERQAVIIQRAWRAKKLRTQWQHLIASGQAPLNTVVEHLHLLDIRVQDAQEELELARTRGELTKLLRGNEKLEDDLDAMDKKIGLLVQNRISVQDVIADKKKGLTLSRPRADSVAGSGSTIGTHRGLKALKKESQDRLKAYQQLFYLLQTDPNYIARLMFAVPQPNTKFLETLIFTLYNYGGNRREEFLLLNLFRAALTREIETKIQNLDDVVKNTPLVLKFVVSYNRNGRGGYMLRQLLGPLIKQVLEDKNLKINVSAVEVYKTWVNQTESETGQPAGLPYDVDLETALQYEEVQKRLERSMNSLKRVSLLFLATITNNVSRFPYGILYIAKVLYTCLAAKFPEAKEKDILKIIGNLIYYKFINPVIVSPDRFDMIDKRQDANLNNEQRRNLAHIAKILQYAASKKGFGNESPHLECMNPFIIECHDKFKDFFAACCQVGEPEAQFNIDQYTEAALIAKPNIYISLAELCDTHQLLIDHKQTVITHKGDPLVSLLSTLGAPSLSSLLGAAEGECSSLSALGRTEVCLVLNPINEGRKDMSDTDRMWVKTKHLLYAILPATVNTGHSDKQTLIGLLKSRTFPHQEVEYNKILDARIEKDAATRHKDLEVFDIFSDEEGRLPLEDAKRQVLKNLRILEVSGYTSSKDGCQSIITDIAKDILNQREHRMERRRDLFRLRRTKGGLIVKQNYMQDQMEQYKQYTNQCLANLNRAGNNKRVHFATLQDGEKGKKMRSKAAVKYSATKLYDKGVLYTIEGLPPSQLKNVQFVFLPLEKDGLFEISARFMGVDMESVNINIQDLLKLQYEGVSVTDMFGKAKINVNLLLYFLNAKFYGK